MCAIELNADCNAGLLCMVNVCQDVLQLSAASAQSPEPSQASELLDKGHLLSEDKAVSLVGCCDLNLWSPLQARCHITSGYVVHKSCKRALQYSQVMLQ